MKRLRWSEFASFTALVTVFASGCVAGAGYGYNDGAGYYQSYGANYGGWGPNYYAGPVREVDHPPEHREGPQERHAEGNASAPRSVPSIPSGSRNGGGSHSH